MKGFLGLFREGMRQTKVFGLTALLLSGASALYFATDSYSSVYEGMTVVYVLALLLPPLCLFRLFNFIASRAGSDFYHSLPAKRQTIYSAFALSSLAWTATAALPQLLFVLAGSLYRGAGQIFLALVLNALGASLLVIGAVCLACSVSGGVLGRVCASGIILFLPRLVVSALADEVASITQVYRADFLSGWNPIMYLLVSANEYGALDSLARLGYGAALGGIYFAIGMLCFVRRPSETAGSSAINKWVQLATRICVALVPCLIAVVSVFDRSTLLLWFLAIVGFFVYDIITAGSGSRQSLKLSMLGLAILVVLNIAMAVSIPLGAKAVLSFEPDAEDIKSVSLSNYLDTGSYSYSNMRAKKVAITDKETIGVLTDALKDDLLLADRGDWDTYYRSDDIRLEVTFKTNLGRRVTRYLRLSRKEYNLLQAKLVRNDEFMDAVYYMPGREEFDYNNISSELIRDIAWDGSEGLFDFPAEYDALREEFNAMPGEKKITAGVVDRAGEYFYPWDFENEHTSPVMNLSPGRLEFCTFYNYSEFPSSNSQYTLTAATPKAAEALLTRLSESDVSAFIKEHHSSAIALYVVEIQPGETPEDNLKVRCYMMSSIYEIRRFIEELEENSGEPDLNKPYYIVTAEAEYLSMSEPRDWAVVTDVFFTK